MTRPNSAMQRIAIIGSPGAGKSTLAPVLGTALGLPIIHLDAVYWRPGWVEPPKDEWAQTVRALTQGEAWIIDGNYSRTMDIRLAAADTIIYLDFPRRLCVWRVLKRAIQYRGRTRPDMGPGCREKLDWKFLLWVWNYPARSRPATLQKLAHCREAGKTVIYLCNPRAVRQFLETL